MAKAIQMARERFRRSPECGGLIVVGVMAASWRAAMLPSGATVSGLVDTTATVTEQNFRACLEEAAADEGVDAVLTPTTLTPAPVVADID